MKQWYKITAEKKRAKILIYEEIGLNFWDEGVSAKQFISDLNKLDENMPIDLFINSPGGSVFEGNSIYNALGRHKAEIVVYIDGVAASIASVVAMAGKKILMPENSLMMIHDPSAMVIGTAADMLKMVEALDRVKTGLVSAYNTHADKTDDEISEMMKAETWMTAQEAVDMGFATEVIAPVKIAANFEAFKYFKNVPESLKIAGNTNQPTGGKEMEITLELIQSKHPEIVKSILAGVDLAYVRENLPDVVETLTAEAKKAGAEAELMRIRSVKDQSISGHEKLIEDLMFDGKTTGPEAAVKVLAAERESQKKVTKNLKDDSPDAIEQPSSDQVADVDENLPIEERCKKQWETDNKLHAEFDGDFDRYLAAEKAIAAGKVKVFNK